MYPRQRDFCFLLFATVVVSTAALVGASEPDLASWVEVPSRVPLGGMTTVRIHYANYGPGDAFRGYLDVGISAGLPVRPDQLTDEHLEALRQSTVGTDTHGNRVLVKMDTASCEGLLLQLQGPDPPSPMQGLQFDGSGSFTLDLPIPMEAPTFGGMVITHPEHLVRTYLPALTWHQRHFDRGMGRYAPGLNCSSFPFAGCTSLGDCFGPRLWMIEPFSAELELVDDGGGFGDPTFGCDALEDFATDRIALIRRGVCPPSSKAWWAQQAGAVAVIIVNNGQCENSASHSEDCVVRMDGLGLASAIDIPVIMLSQRDGEALINEILSGGTVTATMGAMAGNPFEVASFIFSSDALEVDPDPANNGHASRVRPGTFTDDFETGDCSRWSCTTP